MQVHIFHNVTRDGFGRPIGILDGYQPGHDLAEVFAYDTDRTDPYAEAQNAFFLFNVGDDPSFGEPKPLALDYRAKGLRSLSVGDVVVVGDVALACASFGWDAVQPPFSVVAGH